MAKIFLLLTLTMLMSIVEVYADNDNKQPQEGEYFDLVVTPDTTENEKPVLTFNAGNDSCGYMVKSHTDKRYYIFTTMKWIRVKDAKLGDVTNVKYQKGFDYQIHEGKWQKGNNKANEINKSYRSEGYILIKNTKDNNEYKFSLHNYSGEKEEDKFSVIPSDYLKLEDITITLTNTDQDAEAKKALLTSVELKFDENMSDTIKVSAGDFLKIKVKRTARGVLDSVKFNDTILNKAYFLYGQKKERWGIDDMAQITASINLDSVSIPIVEKVKYYKLNIYYSTMENDKFVGKEAAITIQVNPLPGVGLLGGDLNIIYLIIAIVIVLFVIGVIIFVLRRKKGKKVGKVRSESKPDTKFHREGMGDLESKSTENDSTPNSNIDITKPDSSPVDANSAKSVFKNVKDSEVAEFMLNYLLSTFPKMDSNDIDIKGLEAHLNKLLVRKFCKEWNSKYSENKIPGDSFSVEGIFKTIETGYIGPKAKFKIDEYRNKLRETSEDYVNVLNTIKNDITNKTWELANSNAKEKIVPPIKSLLKVLGSVEVFVENNADLDQLKSVIEDSIEKVAGTINELRNNVTELESQVAANDNNLHTALKEKEEELNAIHQRELEAKQSAIESLNKAIEKRGKEIAHLQSVVHDDCNDYIDIVIKQIATVFECMDTLLNGAINVSGLDSQFSNVLRNANESFVRFKERVSNCNSNDKWSRNSYSLVNVRKDLQGFVEEGLRINGWINIISYLNLYAGATAELNDTFMNNGVSAAELSRCYSEIQKLLGMFGVSVIVPHLLYEKFDNKYYKHENGDRWIATYSSVLSPRDFDGRIFDMSNVGYQIDDGEYNKSKVFYN